MPMFEYRCRKCGAVTEFLEAVDGKGAHACDECGSKATEKMFSTFSAQVSASGPACKDGSCPLPSGVSCPTGKCPFG